MQNSKFFEGKKVVVTGGVGTVGRAVLNQLLAIPEIKIRVVDNDESGLFELEQQLREHPNLECFLCDVRDESELTRTFSGMDLCFHTAAFKHVPLCERNPSSAVNTNIMGVSNVVKACLHNHVKKAIFTSSDKAVNPTSVMGTSKLMGERLFTAWNSLASGSYHTVLASTRFGNVAGSRGSVIPLFCTQIAAGGPVTLTDPGMTRFVMSIGEAARLVIRSIEMAQGGEVFVTKMPTLRIEDLAHVMIDMIAPIYGHDPSDIPIDLIGPRPGEKQWEELSTDEESRRIYSNKEFFVVMPVTEGPWDDSTRDCGGELLERTRVVYNSHEQTAMTPSQVREFLMTPGMLPNEIELELNGAISSVG
jgi:FlaA1/EpsC-like NDP-sugar epimerase